MQVDGAEVVLAFTRDKKSYLLEPESSLLTNLVATDGADALHDSIVITRLK